MEKGGRQVIMLYGATFLGAVLNFAASKVNTDVLDPAQYGDVRYVLNIIQLMSWVVLFGLFMSGSRLLALSDDAEYRSRIRGALLLFLSAAALLLMTATAAAGLLHDTPLRFLFFCAVPVAAYPLLTNYMNTTAQGDNHIGRLALARVLPVMCYIPIALILFRRSDSVAPQTVLWLHWGVCTLVLLAIVFSTGPSFRNLKPVFSALRQENREYGIQLYWGSLAMVATNYLAGVTLGWFGEADNTNVGFYTLALSLAQPLSYLPGIVGTTYFRRFVHEDRIPGRVLAVTVALTVLTCIGFIILVRPVVSLYKESYAPVAGYASLLSLGFCIHGLGDMINRYLGSHGQGRSIRNSSFFCGGVKIAGSLLFVWLWNINGAILTMVLSSAVYTLSLFIQYRSYVRNK